MKLTHLHLDQLRQFRQPLAFNDLEAGLNLFVGNNETGKSTIVDAIRAAFFERHRSTSVQSLQPWGDTSAAPEIELAFDWRDTLWRLEKRFLKKQRCDLHVGPDHFSGDDAEEKLAELLGYSVSWKGASKAREHGIPGLLWVEQGAVQNIREPVNHAGDQLQSALGRSLGEITSSGGDELIAQVEQQRSALLTGTGKPRDEYRKAIEQCEQNQADLDNLKQKIGEYEQQVDELGRLRQQQQDIDAAEPWKAQRQQAREAETRLAEVRDWQQQQKSDHKELAACRQNQGLYRQQLKDFAAGTEQLKERAADKDKAQKDLDECQARKPTLDRQLNEAQKAYEDADKTHKRARQEAERSRRQKEHDQLAESLASREKALEEARALQSELQTLREQQQATVIDVKGLDKLKKAQAKISELAIQQEALASRLEYDLDSGKSLTVGKETVTGQGERLLLETTELNIPDVGILRLQPGGADVAELTRQQQQQEAERDGLLRQLGIDTLEAGEQRARDNKKLGQQIAEKTARLEGLAPKGVDELDTQHRLDETQLAQLAEQLAALPEAGSDCPDEKQAEQALAKAHSKLKAVEQAVNDHKSELGIARQALETATAEYEKLNTEIQAAERKQREQQANDALVDLGAEEKRLNDNLQQRQQQIDAAQPDVLAQDIERCNKSADAMEKEAAGREQAIDRLQVALETQGAQGLEEQYDILQQQTQRLQRRRGELERRAKALALLLRILKDKRQVLTRQLQAPLQKHLDHYLKLLFPQASLTVDENLMPDTLTRSLSEGEEQGDIEDLSYGAREQTGLISRLAYADLLREAGKPTLLILDDALVHCDATRLDRMKRILYDAAQRHQILLFSCHPENWRDLGVSARDLQALKSAAA